MPVLLTVLVFSDDYCIIIIRLILVFTFGLCLL